MKVKQCVPCLGTDVKEAIRALGDSALDVVMEKVPDCPDPLGIDLCVKPPRKKSEYQVFIGQCLREHKIKSFGDAPQAMRECSVEWRKRKEGGIEHIQGH